MKFGTKTVHAGVTPDPSTGAIMTPIFQTSTYVQAAPGDHKGYEYARTQNPTRAALERSLAVLDNGYAASCFGSGMAAIDAVIKLLKPGDEVVCCNDLYGGTFRMFTKVFAKYGIRFHFVEMTDFDQVEAHINENTAMLWAETPTNPLLKIIDIEAIAKIAKAHNLLFVVDNTFCSPALQQPMGLGADIVVYSLTKYVSGHSDVVMGAVVVKNAELDEQIKFLQNACGAVPGPMDSFLVLRGIKTLNIRMKAHNENAAKVAEYLKNHPAIGKVYYPGLASHPGHEVAKRQMSGFGGMISFTLSQDNEANALKVLSGTHLFTLAESLGGVESLMCHPTSMTHGSIPREERLKAGLSDTLIRISVGIEDADDLIADLAQVLEQVTEPVSMGS